MTTTTDTKRLQNQYRRLWRWHFFAGLMVAPFAILLAITGAIYLFKPQVNQVIEQSINAQYKNVDIISELTISEDSIQREKLPADKLVDDLLADYPGATFKRFTVAKDMDITVEIELLFDTGVVQNGKPVKEARVFWVDQTTSEVLHQQTKDSQIMNFTKDIHGELLLGDGGSYVVEFMASWMIILLFTGFFLWWPKLTQDSRGKASALASLFVPSFNTTNKREWFKRLHGTIGAWAALFILLFLVTGLPWTQLWGAGFNKTLALFDVKSPGQEWFVTLKSSQPNDDNINQAKTDGISLWDQGNSTANDQTHLQSTATASDQRFTLQDVLNRISSEQFEHPIEIQPPRGEMGVWTVRSMTQYRPHRETVHFDRFTGDEVMRIRFEDHPTIKQITSYGIALHEGALFGPLNQALGVLIALTIIMISISGLVMWWKRKPQGQLLAAPASVTVALSGWMKVVMLVLIAFLPMVAISVVFLLLLDGVLSLINRQSNRVDSAV